MYLFIYAPHPDTSWIALSTRDGAKFKKRVIKKGPSGRGDILRNIDQLMRAAKKTPKHIEGVVVCTGPGHFTYVRSSVVIANTFGWALGIPVCGLADVDEKEFVAAGLKGILKKKRFVPAVPAYGKEPNITQSRNTETR